jgi:hypothetical protein
MFTFDSMIDAVQSSKKTFVNTFVTNETVKSALVTFIDAQTEYTKNAARVGYDTANTVAKETMSAMQNATKFDYSKFGEGIMKAYQAQTR